MVKPGGCLCSQKHQAFQSAVQFKYRRRRSGSGRPPSSAPLLGLHNTAMHPLDRLGNRCLGIERGTLNLGKTVKQMNKNKTVKFRLVLFTVLTHPAHVYECSIGAQHLGLEEDKYNNKYYQFGCFGKKEKITERKGLCDFGSKAFSLRVYTSTLPSNPLADFTPSSRLVQSPLLDSFSNEMKLSQICLDFWWKIGFFAIDMAEVLSHRIGVPSTCSSPKSSSMNLSHLACDVALAALTYSASAVDKATVFCLINAHENIPYPSVNAYPEVLLLSSSLPTQSLSQYPIK
ncbi:folate transporter 1, partial [Prunus dulcis]